MKRAVRWPSVSIHTVQSLQRTNRQLSRKSAGASRVISAMENGASLDCSYERGRTIWKLSTGIFVTSEVAGVVIRNPNVVDVGGCLFGNAGTSQTYRWANHQKEDRHD